MELPWGQHKSWGKAECGNLLSGQQGSAIGSSGWRCWRMFGHHPRPGCYMSQPVVEGLFLGARLAVWALLGAVPMRDGGSAQTDHSPGDSGTNNGQQHPVTSTCLLLILLIKIQKNPHLSLPLAYNVLWFLSPLLLKWCPFHFTVIL